MTSFDGCAVDLEIFWSKSKRCSGDSPAIIIVPDLASASSGEHYVRVLLDTLARRDLGNVCVVNTYRMTILPDDTTYLRACIGGEEREGGGGGVRGRIELRAGEQSEELELFSNCVC